VFQVDRSDPDAIRLVRDTSVLFRRVTSDVGFDQVSVKIEEAATAADRRRSQPASGSTNLVQGRRTMVNEPNHPTGCTDTHMHDVKNAVFFLSVSADDEEAIIDDDSTDRRRQRPLSNEFESTLDSSTSLSVNVVRGLIEGGPVCNHMSPDFDS